jgi:hypothetical protein
MPRRYSSDASPDGFPNTGRCQSKAYSGKPPSAATLGGNGYFDQWQTFRSSTVGMLHRNAFTASPMDEFVEVEFEVVKVVLAV